LQTLAGAAETEVQTAAVHALVAAYIRGERPADDEEGLDR
jgi:hypothetical protein